MAHWVAKPSYLTPWLLVRSMWTNIFMILYSPFDLLLHISQMITCGKHFACDFHCIINLALFCSFVDRDFVDARPHTLTPHLPAIR